jgi:hypothetical protein
MIENPYRVIVISPPSAGGFGRQLATSNASTTQATSGHDKRVCVVFLTEAMTPPDVLDRPKSRCRHDLYYRGL